MRAALLAAVAWLASGALLGCGARAAPAHPTWADVEPILAGECTGCHGASAALTSSGFRFDFYDMTSAVCAAAAQALGPDRPMARALAARIWEQITSPAGEPGVRPRMPPPPAPYLATWEWETIRNWLADDAPRGDMPPGNRPARFRFFASPATADKGIDIAAIVDDPDGDPVVGLLSIGDAATLTMDRSGAFSAHLDTSSWGAGDLTVGAVLCDGWSSVSYSIGMVSISHAK